MERVTPEEFEDGWSFHVSNICNMATNGSCADIVLARALELNPDMTFLEDIRKLYQRTAAIWNGSSGGNLEEGSDDLEALGGGFNVTLTNLQNTAQRAKIAARLREAGAVSYTHLDVYKRQIIHCLCPKTPLVLGRTVLNHF